MKKIFIFLTILFVSTTFSFAQNRGVARGAIPGELYLTGAWYGIYNPNWGPPVYDTLRTAIYRLTENGKKLTIQYDADYFANPEKTMQPNVILADATPGVLYNKDNYSKNSYEHTSLWVSFDYGQNWMFREEDVGSKGYYAANKDGLIYRAEGIGGMFKSTNYGQNFIIMEGISRIGSEPGLNAEDFFSVRGSYPIIPYTLSQTKDLYLTYTEIPIDSLFIFGQIWGIFPDVYRGGLPGEVYISSMFPEENYEVTYKVSFSADTGHTFRHVYVSEIFGAEDAWPYFMSDREPGVFYIIRGYKIEDKDPWGWHTKICVEYYRDYGATLVNTYCHDITKDYVGVGVKPITNDELRITVYPNPTNGELRIENGEWRIENVEIFDVFGRKQSSHHLITSSSHHKIDISHLQSGIYFVRIITEEGTITKKIMKY